VDLGWHLAGGLWIIDHLMVPTIDPFGSMGNPWVCYSWLAEIVFASVYRSGGFFGLKILQLALILMLCLLLFYSLSSQVENNFRNRELTYKIINNFHQLFAFLFALPLIVPIWQLRPQLISLIFLTCILYLYESRKTNYAIIFLLTVFWANIHVYWILAVLVVGVYEVVVPAINRELKVQKIVIPAVILIAGCVSPYGLSNVLVVLQYSFGHGTSEQYIQEFMPLYRANAFTLSYTLVSVLFMSLSWSRLIKKDALPLLILNIVFLLMAFGSIKYLPLYGVSSAFLFIKGPIALLHNYFKLPLAGNQSIANRNSKVSICCGICALFLFSFWIIEPSIAVNLSPLQNEILEISKEIVNKKRAITNRDISIYNEFDDGGWLALGLYLATGSKEVSEIKISIDGRTLVNSAERIGEFKNIRTLNENWCELLKSWNVQMALTRLETKLNQALNQNNVCGKWKSFAKGEYYEAFVLESDH
jgi:hypothetical protein